MPNYNIPEKTVDQAICWKKYPVRVMLGKVYPERGVWGEDIAYLLENDYACISIDTLLKKAEEKAQQLNVKVESLVLIINSSKGEYEELPPEDIKING